VGILVGHVMDRIVDEYAALREVVWNMYMGALRDVLFSTPILRENLRAVCEGKVVGSASTWKVPQQAVFFFVLFANHQDHCNKDISLPFDTVRPFLGFKFLSLLVFESGTLLEP
jgi:hypothetical protein